MVLEDLDKAPDSFTDNPYPSETDPYASTSSPSTGRYDSSTLPQPIPILGPLIGFSEYSVRFKVESTLKFAEYKVHRPLTAEETQALAIHLHKLEQSKSYFSAVGLGLGVWRWYSTMSTNRYPFYLPKPESINPNKFLFVQGPMAQYARHSWRFTLYFAVASRMGQLLGQVVAQPRAAQDTAKDPRLAQFSADLKASVEAENTKGQGLREKMQNEYAELKTREQAAREAAATARGQRGNTSLPEAPSRRPRNVQKATPADDDMSPTAGNDPWPSASTDSWANADFSYDSAQKPQAREQLTPSGNTWGRRSPRPADDDASPTGGMFEDDVQSQSKPGESAWERLRRGGASSPGQQRTPTGRAQPPHREQREVSTLGDSFAFAETDEERKRAQERAQREFDARLERERQGKDFNEEKRW
ncbi:hypothetical protein K458DRAFT_412472 [Lentithecium fluviatile CBS 122367]|uniref:Uncharacterized protein n=1 Tax=Lentithecium fluviatile CBS 122367 TaxID=1168545 RepID=A0A6G1JLX7_9PLEO|nr:hypothetical protein K458DRAFT_412472 [Lentithecium fluviatile CBS 122367]